MTQSSAQIAFRRNIGIFFILLGVLVCSTWAAVKITTDRLLYQNATSAARDWARYLADSVTDLEQIAAGQQPSRASMAVFWATGKPGQVFRYEIFNRLGFSQLVSDHGSVALFDLSEFNPDAAQSARSGKPVVDARAGTQPDQPSFFATAYVPVMVGGRTIAVVAAYIDQTEQRDSFYKAFLLAAAALCLTTGLSFLIPAIAWLRRTQEKQQAERHVRFLAHHDALTGLCNRARLMDELQAALAGVAKTGGQIAVHFIDLDRFKEVNDTLGHDGGDFVLATVAGRLRAVTRAGDIAARLGGDEFVVVQTGIGEADQAKDFAQRLASALTAPMLFREQEITATVSIGIALAPRDGTDAARLLKCADLALYKSKADGRNCIRFFAPELDAVLQGRLAMEKIVRDAVLNERFVLHYQPLYHLASRRLIGFEALIRLPAADGSLIPPMTFIPVAESLRLIDKIGAWALQEACRTAATWPSHLTVAVNLSPAQFGLGNIRPVVASALEEAGLGPHRLELEITETLLLGGDSDIMEELHGLKTMGVAIVIDDFGIGYSSLSYLWRFPFDKIKIDRSFMQGIDDSTGHAETVVKTIITLARELQMRVTVEGVENAGQIAFLDGADADQVQGYFFCRPVPAANVAAVILNDIQTQRAAQVTAPVVRPRLIVGNAER
jgi:diguanylate cyclase (GGDEF)-like protein